MSLTGMIRNRFSSLFIFLVMGCILMEDAMPFFRQLGQAEMVMSDNEKNTDEGKFKGEGEFDLFKVKENPGALFLFPIPGDFAAQKLAVRSDDIPASASRAVFSPPPERV